MFTQATESVCHQSRKNKERYDQKCKQMDFKVGDKVMLKSHPISTVISGSPLLQNWHLRGEDQMLLKKS